MADTKLSALTAKATPVAADILHILDSAASNVDKRTTAGALPVSTPQQTALDAKLAATITSAARGQVIRHNGTAFRNVAPEIVYVEDFGAVGDGTTNDYTAIAAAIAALPTYTAGLGGGTVVFGPKTYLTGTAIDQPSGVTFRGAGKATTKLVGTLSTPIVKTTLTGTAAEVYFFLTIRDMTIQNLSTNSAARAVEWCQVTQGNIQDCRIMSAGGDMFKIRSGDDITCQNVKFQGAVSDTCVNIDGLSAAGYVNLVTFNRCAFQDAKCGIKMIGGSNLTVHAAQFETLAGGLSGHNRCVSLDGVKGVSFTGTTYVDSCVPMFIGTNNSEDQVRELEIQNLQAYNTTASYYVFLDAVLGARIGVAVMTNGAGNANANGIHVEAPAAGVHVGHATLLSPGSGTAVSVAGAGNSYLPTMLADIASALAGVASAAPLIDDHFVTGHNITSLSLGSSGFGVTGGTGSAIASEAGHPGIERCAVTNSNPTTGGFINRGGGVTGGPMMDENFDLQIKVRYGLNGGAKAQTTALRFGFSSTMISATDPTEAAYFECLAADTNWFAVTRLAGVQTRTDTTVAFGDTNWLTGRITRVGANVAFVLNGGTTINHTTNLPAGGGQFGATARTTEAVAKNIDLDRLTLYSIG